MKNIKISQRMNKEVILMKQEWKKIVDTKNITADFNNIVIEMFNWKPRIITNNKWDKYKITIEREYYVMWSRYGTTLRGKY